MSLDLRWRIFLFRPNRGKYKVFLPQLRSDPEGFEYISQLSNMLGPGSTLADLEIDFSGTVWVDAHMLAPLGALLYAHRSRGFSVQLSNIPPAVEGILRKNGFLSAFEDEIRTKDTWGTVIPYRRYISTDEKSFPLYMAKLAKNRGNLRFNDNARNAILFTTLELFNNAIYHGRSASGVFVCGQYYPNANKLKFSLCDLGVGIPANVTGFTGRAMTDAEAISWAVERGNSTRPKRPGGMGLYFLKNFAVSNNGLLHIISGDAIVSEGKNQSYMKTTQRFNGTYISLEINTDSQSTYISERIEEGENDELF
ncbi:ATP-binding protein [Deinococcus taeanensis]|uniref:ATP-binding protein n=1 Tax=Deinococcus taeanensis TaxID=2737050 RepID=UPI001CDD4826|nr:ATP-binding protein [Deinococcus taeanensis]UBV43254.1 ATP-binding protein [Deinococcus taeanensis]